MSHAALVWANLRRRPLQSLLCLACATLAFAIYGVMFGVLDSFRHSSIQNPGFEQQLARSAMVLSAAGMALILLLTAGAMAHAVRLRLHEFGVLKALGFSHRRIIALIVVEAAAPCMAGAVIGLLLVPLLFAVMAAGLPQLATLPAPTYSASTLGGALLIAFTVAAASSVLPALRIARLDAASALTGSADAAKVSAMNAGVQEGVVAARPSVALGSHTFGDIGTVPGLLRQILIVTRIGFATLPQRTRSALLITVGMACTTFVLVWVLSMVHTMRSTILGNGDPARVVLRNSSTAWLHDSRLPEGVAAISAAGAGVAQAADGSPMAEAMLHANIGAMARHSGRGGPIDIVGVGPHWREMTPSFRLLSGRLPRRGTHEVMVGQLARRALLGLDGGPFKGKGTMYINGKAIRGVEWTVVGTFTTGGWWDGYLVGDIDTLRQYSNGLSATAVLVRLDSPRSYDAFRGSVLSLLPPGIQVEREAETYAAFWRSIVPKALLFIAFALICLLAVGATLATMMVAHSALEARRREIATLRLLGFDGRAAAASILLETLPFALLGAWIGAAIVWVLVDGDLKVGAWSVVEVEVSLSLIFFATGCAAGIAMIGTLPLALKTLRRRALEGLQDLRGMDAATVGAVRRLLAPARARASTSAFPGLARQVLVATRIGFSTLPQRARSALLITGGVACTTFVLLWLLSLAEGIRNALLHSADPARVVIKDSSTRWLSNSRLPDRVEVIAAGAPGVARSEEGRPLAEAVYQATIGVVRRDGRPTGIDIVGVGPHWREMTPSFRLLSGRLPRRGTHEVMVGHLAPRALLGLDGGPVKSSLGLTRLVGEKEFKDVEWRVVGTFSTGDWNDGHLIGDIDVLRQYGGGLAATGILVRLQSPQSFGAFRSAVAPQLPSSIEVEREADTYARLWEAIPKYLLYVAYVLGALLASGAVLGTMQVADAALEARRREIATLRVLGFDGKAAALSVLFETLPFAVLGALAGAGLVWMWRHGQVWAGAGSVFEIGVDLRLLLVATGCAVTIAMVGTLPLAVKSLRRAEMDGLRDLRKAEEMALMPDGYPEIWRPSIGLGVLPLIAQ